MRNSSDQKVADLERAFPAFQVWYVPRAVGGMTWHARRWNTSDYRTYLNADTAADLEEQLEAEAER